MSFRFDFELSDDSETDDLNTGMHEEKRGRFEDSSSSDSSDNDAENIRQDPSQALEKDLPMVNPRVRVIEIGVKKVGTIYNGLRRMSYIQPIKISSDVKMVTEAMTTINRGLCILSFIHKDHGIEWLEWTSVNNMINQLIPDRNSRGKEIRTSQAWRSYKMNISRSTRKMSWFRLTEALHIMGNEFPELKVNCHKLLCKLFQFLLGQNLVDRRRQDWAENMLSKPRKIERMGWEFSYV